MRAGRFKYLEAAHEGVVDGHHRPRVVELPAVVGGGEYGNQLAACKEFVTVLHDLVGADDQIEVVPGRREAKRRGGKG